MKTGTLAIGRMLRFAAIGAVALTMVPLHGASAQESSPLDLPAALLTPADVADAGFGDYGVSGGWYISPEDRVHRLLQADWERGEAETAVEESGVGMEYRSLLYEISDVPHDTSDRGIVIQSTLVEYDSADQASEGFAAFEDETGVDGAEDLSDPPAIGDETEVTEFIFPADNSMSALPVHEIDVSFRIGNVTAIVAVAGFDETVDRASAEQLAQRLVENVISLVEDGKVNGARTANLTAAAPMFTTDKLCVCRAMYTIQQGDVAPYAFSIDESDAIQSIATDYGITAQFLTTAKYGTLDATNASLVTRVTRFSSANDAARYVDEAESWADDSALTVTLGDEIDATAYAENARAFSITTSGETFANTLGLDVTMQGTRVLVQDGRIVYEFDLYGSIAPADDAVAAVVASTLSCQESACIDSAEPPAELTSYFDEQELLDQKSG
jgi:hypothetical protein